MLWFWSGLTTIGSFVPSNLFSPAKGEWGPTERERASHRGIMTAVHASCLACDVRPGQVEKFILQNRRRRVTEFFATRGGTTASRRSPADAIRRSRTCCTPCTACDARPRRPSARLRSRLISACCMRRRWQSAPCWLWPCHWASGDLYSEDVIRMNTLREESGREYDSRVLAEQFALARLAEICDGISNQMRRFEVRIDVREIRTP